MYWGNYVSVNTWGGGLPWRHEVKTVSLGGLHYPIYLGLHQGAGYLHQSSACASDGCAAPKGLPRCHTWWVLHLCIKNLFVTLMCTYSHYITSTIATSSVVQFSIKLKVNISYWFIVSTSMLTSTYSHLCQYIWNQSTNISQLFSHCEIGYCASIFHEVYFYGLFSILKHHGLKQPSRTWWRTTTSVSALLLNTGPIIYISCHQTHPTTKLYCTEGKWMWLLPSDDFPNCMIW